MFTKTGKCLLFLFTVTLLFPLFTQHVAGCPMFTPYGFKYLGYPFNSSVSPKITANDGPITIRPNRYGRFYDSSTSTYTWRLLTQTEQDFVMLSVNETVETLNAIPDTFLKFQVGSWLQTQSTTFTNNTDYLPVTWDENPAYWGACYISYSSFGNTLPRGIIVNFPRFYSIGSARGIIVGEILHILGEDHSGLTYSLTLDEYGVASLGALNCHEYAIRPLAPHPLLHYDDFSWISYLYPNPNTYHYNTGDFVGEVKDASGNPVFGAHVFAVNENGVALISSITGLHEYTGSGSIHGKFILPHLPPGKYDVIITSLTDTRFPTIYPPHTLLHSFYFSSTMENLIYPNAPFTIIRDVYVFNQYKTDLGQITLGTDVTSPSVAYSLYPFTMDYSNAIVRVEVPTYPSALGYIVYAERTDGEDYPCQYWLIKDYTSSTAQAQILDSFNALPPSHDFSFITKPGSYRFYNYWHDGTRYVRRDIGFATLTAGVNYVDLGMLR